jgi:hypothetical protein
MTRTVSLIDSAIGSLKAARDDLRHAPDLLASDLSAVIGTTRELTWTIDTMLAVLVDAYGHQNSLGHDNGIDPTAIVARIVERLAHTRRFIDSIDGMLADAHNHAARLHNLDR